MRRFQKFAFLVLILVMGSSVRAAGKSEREGGLTPDVIRDVRQSFKMDTSTRALMNALTNNEIKKLALNREMYVAHDKLFNHKIKPRV